MKNPFLFKKHSSSVLDLRNSNKIRRDSKDRGLDFTKEDHGDHSKKPLAESNQDLLDNITNTHYSEILQLHPNSDQTLSILMVSLASRL